MKTDLTATGYIFFEDKLLLIHHNKLDTWLPVGGHIESNETPDQTLLREVKEETNLDVEILGDSDIPVVGTTKRNIATPFYVNVHSVGDHDHCSFFYICKAKNPGELKINKELRAHKWVTEEELNSEDLQEDVKMIAKKAFKLRKTIQG